MREIDELPAHQLVVDQLGLRRAMWGFPEVKDTALDPYLGRLYQGNYHLACALLCAADYSIFQYALNLPWIGPPLEMLPAYTV